MTFTGIPEFTHEEIESFDTFFIGEFTDDEIYSYDIFFNGEFEEIMTEIYRDTDHLYEMTSDDSNYSIYLHSQGNYWNIGYNYSKDREWTIPHQLTRPSEPPIQGPLTMDEMTSFIIPPSYWSSPPYSDPIPMNEDNDRIPMNEDDEDIPF